MTVKEFEYLYNNCGHRVYLRIGGNELIEKLMNLNNEINEYCKCSLKSYDNNNSEFKNTNVVWHGCVRDFLENK